MEGLLTVKEAADRLTVSSTRIRAMLEDGLLVGEKQNDGRGDWLITQASLDAQRAMYGAPSRRVKLQVVQRDGSKCRDCGNGDVDSFHVHHLNPRSEGGSNEEDNLITLCCTCHADRHHGILSKGLKGIAYIRDLNASVLCALQEPLVIHDGNASARPLVIFIPYAQYLAIQSDYLQRIEQR